MPAYYVLWMRGVCRSWRDALADKMQHAADYYMNMAVIDGANLRGRGTISQYQLQTYFECGYYDLLMLAEYEWAFVGNEQWLLNMEKISRDHFSINRSIVWRLHARVTDSDDDCNYSSYCTIEKLFMNIIRRCSNRFESPGGKFATAIARMDALGLITYAHCLGIKFGEDAFVGVRCKTFVHLHSLGFKWGDDIIKSIVEYHHDDTMEYSKSDLIDTIIYIESIGQQINPGDNVGDDVGDNVGDNVSDDVA
jgi:hypothetical protein